MGMVFDELMGLEKKEDKSIFKREAVRGIVIKGKKILMVLSNKGDVKLPGGGIEYEDHYHALKREIKEETGYEVETISSLIGRIIERKLDEYDESSYFEMISYYYCVKVKDSQGELSLTESEKALEMKPIWLTIPEAINKYEVALKQADPNSWINRELKVLKLFLKHLERIIIE
jgi:8-oxo-dGTP pyrophosphatase MutT (NUDIX family)